MAAIQEIRAKNTSSILIQLKNNLKLESEGEFVIFEENFDTLRFAKNDYLIAVQVNGNFVDLRRKASEEINQLITSAIGEKNIVFRIVKRGAENYEKFLHAKRVRAISDFDMRYAIEKHKIAAQPTGSTISSEMLYFVDCQSSDRRSEKVLGSNERYIH